MEQIQDDLEEMFSDDEMRVISELIQMGKTAANPRVPVP
jgi:hypothetical protein